MPQDGAKTAVYLDYSQEELDWQYDHSQRFSDIGAFGRRNAADSARARDTLEVRRDIPYEAGADQLLDVFPAGQGAPVAVFLHGGSWRNGSKDQVEFPAESFVPRGVAWVAVNFTNIDECGLDEMVRQCRAALVWVWRNAESFGGDPSRIHVLGHSSGSHLTAMMLTTDWQTDWDAPADLIRGAAAVSGIYDLQPVVRTYRSKFLKLDEAGWRRNSPILNIPKVGPPILVACGELETAEFHRQPRAFVEAWRKAGHQAEFMGLEGLNHFTARDAYNHPDGPLLPAIFRLIGV